MLRQILKIFFMNTKIKNILNLFQFTTERDFLNHLLSLHCYARHVHFFENFKGSGIVIRQYLLL